LDSDKITAPYREARAARDWLKCPCKTHRAGGAFGNTDGLVSLRLFYRAPNLAINGHHQAAIDACLETVPYVHVKQTRAALCRGLREWALA